MSPPKFLPGLPPTLFEEPEDHLRWQRQLPTLPRSTRFDIQIPENPRVNLLDPKPRDPVSAVSDIISRVLDKEFNLCPRCSLSRSLCGCR